MDPARGQLLPGTPQAKANPYAGLNVGIVEVDSNRAQASLRFKILSPRADASQLDIVFDSGLLDASLHSRPLSASVGL